MHLEKKVTFIPNRSYFSKKNNHKSFKESHSSFNFTLNVKSFKKFVLLRSVCNKWFDCIKLKIDKRN